MGARSTRARALPHRLIIVIGAAMAGACSGSPTVDDPTATNEPTLLLSVEPAAGAVDVSVTTDIEVRFDHGVPTTMRTFIALHEGDCPGPVVVGIWSLTSDQMGLGFAPMMALLPGTEYTVHVGGGMTDPFGMPFDLRRHGIPLGGESVTEAMVLGSDGMGMGMDMMGQPITHTGTGWAHADGTYGLAFMFTTEETQP